MFGHNDDNQQQDQNQNDVQAAPPASDQPAAGFPAFTPPAPVDNATPDANGQNDNMQLPDSNLPGNLSSPAPSEDASAAPAPATSAPTPPSSDNDGGLSASPNDLIRIKQDALQQLSPLVDHLDQSPEERFRTVMMLIQATDDSSLIKEAYDIAQQISDDKVKAQALLDVVNEINYFSQQANNQDHEAQAA